MSLRLEGRAAIVTGGAGSIGLASARRMVQEGARVMLVDLDARPSLAPSVSSARITPPSPSRM